MQEPSAVERYRAAGRRANTQRSYQAAVDHYEQHWGGFLPATGDTVAAYLAAYGAALSINTLRSRLAGLAHWHAAQGFPDPTKAPIVKEVLRGIRASHPQPIKQAQPLQLAALQRCVRWLHGQIEQARSGGDVRRLPRLYRDQALLLLGFWRAFRSDELCRLQVQWNVVQRGQGMKLFLPTTKNDRQNLGTHFHVPSLQSLCPVQAYEAWIAHAGLAHGPVFRRIDRWGRVGEQALHPYSVGGLLRRLLCEAGVAEQGISSHSLRRGFAGWAASNGWDQKSLMSYVGWRDPVSALRYLDANSGLTDGRLWRLPTAQAPA
ncbi:site-specific integrase [Pseudomonas typographi]|uniref:site-specific integrase n=1 Tax=Pseudomonas typographi TaxID=2715964 RepID=UPI001688548C|nr:site-specific integrase [Pseudomonas typographi]MBD1551205.1 site-specific integrase [Pseudomonas typographi]MBD1586301.1 site-specific integrase [Pseudomonas typographi]